MAPSVPRLASTVLVLMRDPKLMAPFRVLMVKRHSKARFGRTKSEVCLSNQCVHLPSDPRFMANAHVFPGGVREKADGSECWHRYCNITPPTEEAATEVSRRICAVRELFEESGLLLSASPPSTRFEAERIQWRRRCQESPSAFAQMCDEMKIRPDIEGLKPYARWVSVTSTSNTLQ